MAVSWKVEIQGIGANQRRLRQNERFVLEFADETAAIEYINQLVGAFPNQFSTIMTRNVLSEKEDITKLIAQTVRFFS